MLTELSALLDLLKAKGVTHARLEPWNYPPGKEMCGMGVIDVTFAPEAPSLPDDEKSKPQDMCKCGHELAQHQGGLCLGGCEEGMCS